MRNLILGVLLLPAFAQAQPVTVEKPVVCDKVKNVIEYLSGSDIQEQPFWAGIDKKSRYLMMVNKETNSWTLIQFNDQIACIIGSGENSKLLFTGPKL